MSSVREVERQATVRPHSPTNATSMIPRPALSNVDLSTSMPPIPLHIDDPITPQKQAPTPTTPAPSSQFPLPASVSATTTSASSATTAYPAARPGPAAIPSPTPFAPPPPSRTTQPPLDPHAPPSPQPGAVPLPPTHLPTAAARRAIGDVRTPHQMDIPSPTQNYTPSHSTLPMPPQQQQQPPPPMPTALRPGPPSSPPAYHQNAYAQDLSAAPRSQLVQPQESRAGAAFGGSGDGDEGGMWGAVRGWVSATGKVLAQTEESVWKRINGQQR